MIKAEVQGESTSNDIMMGRSTECKIHRQVK